MSFYDINGFSFLRDLRSWLWGLRLRNPLKLKYGKVLDLGCGCGDLTGLFRENSKFLFGCDKSRVSLKHAVVNDNSIHFFYHDIDNDVLNTSFDLILSIGVLHHTKKGIKNLIKYNSKIYIIGLYRKYGFYWLSHKFLKGKNWFKHVWWQDRFMSPTVSFYSKKDIPKEFDILSRKRLFITPMDLYILKRRKN